MEMMELGESERLEPHSDIHALFCHYNSLYFDDALGACIVSWSSSRMTSCAGICRYLQGGGCEIRLSEPLLKFRSTADLKNTLLHEMIHAFLWIMSNNKDHSDHGPSFRAVMNAINFSSVTDPQRPSDGYNITIYHDFHQEVDSYRVHHWICELCGDLIKRAMNREPSANDCIEHTGLDKSCGNLSCHWHRHKMLCSGVYTKIAEPPGYKDKRKVSKGAHNNDGDKSKEPSYTTRQSTKRLHKAEGTKDVADVKKSNKITNLFPSLGDAATSSGIESPSGIDYHFQRGLNNKQLKGIELKTEGDALAGEIPKRARTPGCRKKRRYSCVERKKYRKRKREITVAIAWLDYYADEESEEDIEPLINKRTERRKKQKLLKELKGRWLNTEAIDDACPSQAGSYSDSLLLCYKDGERWRPGTTLEDRREAYEGSSQLNSPLGDNIVYISDS